MNAFYMDHGALQRVDVEKASVRVLKGGSTGLIQYQHPTPIQLALEDKDCNHPITVNMTVDEVSDLIEQLNEAVNCSVSHHTL